MKHLSKNRKGGESMSKQQEIIKTLHIKPTIQPKEEIRFRIEFLKEKCKKAKAKGFILGISGGQDSTLAGKLTQLAVDELNKEGYPCMFVALRLPYGIQKDEEDARLALNFIQPTDTMVHDIKPEVDAGIEEHRKRGRSIRDFIKGNRKARIRMVVQYDLAGEMGLLVIGTDHGAEAVTGFYTKFGDGACDLVPLAGLTKGQGREMLKELGATEKLYLKIPTADLLDEKPQQTDEEELGLSYHEIDAYLTGKEINHNKKEQIQFLYDKTEHKRQLPITPFD